MRGPKMMAGVALVLATGLPASAATAQSAGGKAVLQSFVQCRSIAVPEARLACFEQATSALEKAVSAKEVTLLDRQDVRKARRSLFGFSLPRIGLFGGGDGDDDKEGSTEPLETTIVGSRALPNGRYELRLAEEDAVWATTDPMSFPPKAGSKVRIRRGALGNYFIAIDGERSIRGMRVR